MAEFVKIEKGLGPDGRIAVVRFDRGDGINALSPEALRQLTDAARSFEDDDATSVVVLTGGAKSFTAGFDLKDPEGRSRKSMDLGALRRHLKLGPRLTRAWQEMEQITIGAIEGFCVGGGVALAVALDFRVMARDAHMRVPEIGLGMNMSWQSVPRMLHLMGPARTKQAVILADQRISAAEAYEWRLVEEVADPGKAFDAAMALAAKVAAQPPLSVAMTKLTVNRLAHALDDLASHMDVDQFALASMSEDHKEGVAAFLERRKPRFRGKIARMATHGQSRHITLRVHGGNSMKTVQTMLAEAEAEVPRISPDEAKGLLGRADVLFLDVREPAEVATSGKVPGALAVPRGLVEFRADPASAMHDTAFDRAKTVIAYCASGGRSALVGKTLKDMGYSNVRNLGGFKGWLEAGGEVEKA